MADLIDIGTGPEQNVIVEYSNYDSVIKGAVINVDTDTSKTLSMSAIKTTDFDGSGGTVDSVCLQLVVKDSSNSVELVLGKEATKNLLVIVNKIYNYLTPASK